MKKVIPYKGKKIVVKTMNNSEGSIVYITSKIGLFSNPITSRLFIWDCDSRPKLSFNKELRLEVERLIQMQQYSIDLFEEKVV